MTPWAPARACRQPGCPARVPSTVKGGYCPEHAAQRQKESNAYQANYARGPEEALYNTARWRKCRAWFLNHHPVCESGAHGDYPPLARYVHHRQKVSEHPELLTVEENLQALCGHCHAIETAKEIKERGGHGKC